MIFDTFNCNTNPFVETLDLELIQLDDRFLFALEQLKAFPDMGDIAILTARTGLGKTTLLRQLIKVWNPNFDVYYLHLGTLRDAGFFRAIITLLGETPQMGKDRMFDQIFSQLSKRQRPLCLLMDEAQLMDIPSMTDLRLLCGNLHLTGRLKLLLCGQPSLKRTLQAESLTDLRERLSLQIKLKPMTQLETIAYLEHRLKTAGGTLAVFEESAIQLIVNYSEGVPRKVNNIAFRAMLNAAHKQQKNVNATCVREACAAEGA